MPSTRSPIRRLLAAGTILLMLIALWCWKSGPGGGHSPHNGTAAAAEGGPATAASPSAADSARPSARGRRPELKTGGADAEKLVEVASSGVHALIPVGHCMVTGGYATGDGRFGFVVLKPTWLELASGARQIRVETTILNVDQEALARTGLDSLVTGRQKTFQNAEVWTPEDVAQSLGDSRGLEQLSTPSILTTPGVSAQVRMESVKTSFTLDLEVSEAAEGAFEVKSGIKLLE